MRPVAITTTLFLLLFFTFSILPVLGSDQAAPTFGVGPGARVFFTQCYPGDNPTPEQFKQLAETGFTVVARCTDIFDPVNNAGSLKMMPAYFSKASDAGLDAAIFQGGMAPAKAGDTMRVGRDGKAGPYRPAHSPSGWQAIGNTLVDWAKLSKIHSNFKFTGIDFEFYLGGGPDFGESYDDETFTGFFKSTSSTPPSPLPAPEKRYEHIQNSGLLDRYTAYQRKLVLEEVRRVRARIDEVNPRFQIGAYGWGSLFSAVLEGFATPSAPVIHLDPETYGRGKWDIAYDKDPEGGYAGTKKFPDRKALKWAHTYVGKACRTSRACGWPEVHLSGHWPQVAGPDDGSQYRFTARQAFNSAAYGDGYWIWTEQYAPKPFKSLPEWIDAMLPVFKQANSALDAADFTWSNRQPNTVIDPNATKPMAIVTTDGKKVSVWNPITGELVVTRMSSTEPKTRSAAIGDVDGIAGSEKVTLNAGWIRIWDIESRTELLRFRVGSDQTNVWLEECKSEWKGPKL